VRYTQRPVLSLQTAGPEAALAQLGAGRFLRTGDGGRSWRRFRLRYETSFATARVGLGFRTSLVRGQEVLRLLATEDGGKTWNPRPSPCGRTVADSALVDLVTPTLGWVVCLGEPGAGNQAKAIFRTTDGGRSWQARARAGLLPRSNDRGGIAGYGYPEGIAFARDGFGLLWESRGTLYVTRDGGSHWAAKPKLARPEVDFGRGAAAFPGGRGFALLGRGGGDRARLLATHDYGETWHPVIEWNMAVPLRFVRGASSTGER
jgi:photosystem II stability/assembly factor-like uncharacterized protein